MSQPAPSPDTRSPGLAGVSGAFSPRLAAMTGVALPAPKCGESRSEGLEVLRLLHERGLSLTDLLLLAALAGQPGQTATASELVALTGIRRTLLDYYLGRAERRHLLARGWHRVGRRHRLLTLTTQGRAVARALGL